MILGYTVTYRALSVCSVKPKNVTTPRNNLMLIGLNEYTNYSIRVFASTVKGNGTVSAAIIITTDQDGKCTLVGCFRCFVSSLAEADLQRCSRFTVMCCLLVSPLAK